MYLLKPADTLLSESLLTFTFHYVSIKTVSVYDSYKTIYEFTFHYVSIKTVSEYKEAQNEMHLHSTMYLLKRIRHLYSLISVAAFTFHYVSIITLIFVIKNLKHSYLHSTMYLLKPNGQVDVAHEYINLHSTMYLLKH